MSRIDRVNQSVKEEIGRILQFDFEDQRLKFVTIVEVKVSRDLQHAKVYFTALRDPSKIEEVLEALTKARGLIRHLLSQRLQMRYTPEIDFILDKSIEYGQRIDETIERIKDEFPSAEEID